MTENPRPDQAPYPEPPGYSIQMGFVKSNPLNNDIYVEQWQGDPWYPFIKEAHDELTAKFPGYNISQLKEKFRALRYYIDQGDCPDDAWDWEVASQIAHAAEDKTYPAKQDSVDNFDWNQGV